MRPAYYQEQWDTLKALPAPHPEQLKSLAQRTKDADLQEVVRGDDDDSDGKA